MTSPSPIDRGSSTPTFPPSAPASSERLFSPSVDFERVVARRTPEERSELIRLAQLHSEQNPEQFEAFSKALYGGDWKNHMWELPIAPYFALQMLIQGNLSELQFATCALYCDLVQDMGGVENVEVISLFQETGEENNEAYELICETMQLWSSEDACSPTRPHGEWASPDEIHTLLERAQAELPPFEHVLFLYEGSYSVNSLRVDPQSPFREPTIAQAVQASIGYHVFDGLQNYGQMRMLVPTALKQLLREIKFGDETVRTRPVIGCSTEQHLLENGRDDEREKQVPFPGYEMPARADGSLSGSGNDFSFHDDFHGDIASLASRNVRHLICDVFESLRTFSSSIFQDHAFGKKVASHLLDMEFEEFRQDELDQYSPEYRNVTDMFWRFIRKILQAAYFLMDDTPLIAVRSTALELGRQIALKLRAQAEPTVGSPVHEMAREQLAHVDQSSPLMDWLVRGYEAGLTYEATTLNDPAVEAWFREAGGDPVFSQRGARAEI